MGGSSFVSDFLAYMQFMVIAPYRYHDLNMPKNLILLLISVPQFSHVSPSPVECVSTLSQSVSDTFGDWMDMLTQKVCRPLAFISLEQAQPNRFMKYFCLSLIVVCMSNK